MPAGWPCSSAQPSRLAAGRRPRLAAPAPPVTAVLRLDRPGLATRDLRDCAGRRRRARPPLRVLGAGLHRHPPTGPASAHHQPTPRDRCGGRQPRDDDDVRAAVTALLAHADAWTDADPDRRLTRPLRALARAHASADRAGLVEAARSLLGRPSPPPAHPFPGGRRDRQRTAAAPPRPARPGPPSTDGPAQRPEKKDHEAKPAVVPRWARRLPRPDDRVVEALKPGPPPPWLRPRSPARGVAAVAGERLEREAHMTEFLFRPMQPER